MNAWIDTFFCSMIFCERMERYIICWVILLLKYGLIHYLFGHFLNAWIDIGDYLWKHGCIHYLLSDFL